jgi:hypothetical protein
VPTIFNYGKNKTSWFRIGSGGGRQLTILKNLCRQARSGFMVSCEGAKMEHITPEFTVSKMEI